MTLEEANEKYPPETLVKRNDSACAFRLKLLMTLKIFYEDIPIEFDSDDWEICNET